MDLARLRKETRSDHEEVEGSLPLMRADLERDLYTAVLCHLFGFVEAWERTVRTGIPDELAPWAAERNRAVLLKRDLSDLGVEKLDVAYPELPGFNNLAELMGAMYVIEGSRLGGQLIARHVDTVLGLGHGKGSRFFRGFGDETGAKWREFLQVLQQQVSEQETSSAIHGAKKMFGAFGMWMRAIELPTH